VAPIEAPGPGTRYFNSHLLVEKVGIVNTAIEE
jgi:hypothetical protein